MARHPHLYFAYGSNMNPARVMERGLQAVPLSGATLQGVRLAFNKASPVHPNEGHANLCFDATGRVEGVLYRLATAGEITLMDPFEAAPYNYSRELVAVRCGTTTHWAWTYFANPAVIADGLRPSREYLNHLLAGRPFLSQDYYTVLASWPCHE